MTATETSRRDERGARDGFIIVAVLWILGALATLATIYAVYVIDTAVYRFGDLSSAWMLTGLRAAGFGLLGAMTFGIAVSAVWGAVAVALGRRYEALGGKPAA